MPRYRLCFALVLALACTACRKPVEPPRDQPPEPQAAQLRDAPSQQGGSVLRS